MKRFSLLILSLALLATGPVLAASQTVELAVDNMTCVTCAPLVQRTLERIEGVEAVSVSFREQAATVTFDDERTSVEALTGATRKAGFPSRLAETE